MTQDVKADETRFHDADVREAAEQLRGKIGDLPVAMGGVQNELGPCGRKPESR